MTDKNTPKKAPAKKTATTRAGSPGGARAKAAPARAKTPGGARAKAAPARAGSPGGARAKAAPARARGAASRGVATAAKKRAKKAESKAGKTVRPRVSGRTSQAGPARDRHTDDMSLVIVDDDIEIDQDRVNEERRAYLEEARSQEAFD